MLKNEIRAKYDQAIIESTNYEIEINDLNDDTDFIDDLYFDSLSIVSLIAILEETFNITIPDEFLIMENIRNYKILFEKIIDLVMKNE